METPVSQTAEMPDRILLTVEKSDKHHIMVRESVFKDKGYIDIRIFNKNSVGDYLPTKKGVTLPRDIMKELIKGMYKMKI